jgi:hypothetical protein
MVFYTFDLYVQSALTEADSLASVSRGSILWIASQSKGEGNSLLYIYGRRRFLWISCVFIFCSRESTILIYNKHFYANGARMSPKCYLFFE